MMENEKEFLRDLQGECLKEADDYTQSFREALAGLGKDPQACLASMMKIVHSMKGNLQAVAFLSFGEFVHTLESALEEKSASIKAVGGAISETDATVLEFMLSNVLDAVSSYINDLKATLEDKPELLAKHGEPLGTLRSWVPEASVPAATPAAAPAAAIATPPEPTPPEPAPAVASAAPAAAAAPASPPAPPKAAKAPPPAERSRDEPSLFLLFQNSSQYFAISVEHVVEIVKSRPLTAPPMPRKNLSGLFILRGEVLPIVQIPEIEVPGTGNFPYVVVSRVQDRQFGFQVEAVHQVVRLEQDKFQDVNTLNEQPGTIPSTRFLLDGDRTICVLAMEKLVAA